jgi:hypothetical protein
MTGYLALRTLHNLNIQNLDIFFWLLLVHPCILNLMNDIQALDRPSESRVLVVQPGL